MKYALFYENAEDMSRARLYYDAHTARFDEFKANHGMLMCGPFTDSPGGGLIIFTSREGAERFAKGDPFVLNGVVRHWYVREWNEVVADE